MTNFTEHCPSLCGERETQHNSHLRHHNKIRQSYLQKLLQTVQQIIIPSECGHCKREDGGVDDSQNQLQSGQSMETRTCLIVGYEWQKYHAECTKHRDVYT